MMRVLIFVKIILKALERLHRKSHCRAGGNLVHVWYRLDNQKNWRGKYRNLHSLYLNPLEVQVDYGFDQHKNDKMNASGIYIKKRPWSNTKIGIWMFIYFKLNLKI